MKCVIVKKSELIKEQEASGLLSSLGIKAPLSKISLVGYLLFQEYKINEILNKFLLAVDKIMPEMHLNQPGFTYSACGTFTKKESKNLRNMRFKIYLSKRTR